MEMVPATTAAFTRDAAWHFRKCQAASLVKAAVVAGTISIGYPQAVALQIVGITAMPC